MGLFSKKRSQDHHGFSKYTDELARSANDPNSLASVQRAQSLSGASQAALAALQKHQKPVGLSSGNPNRHSQSRVNARANSLGGYRRSNSMQSYTYTPRASYLAGPSQSPLQGSPSQVQSYAQGYPQQSQRAPSLRSNSFAGSVRSGQRRNFMSPPVFPEEEEHQLYGHGDDVVITTKTTKVLDALGRTRSITTETIRRMPDGSNVIETKTTNVSRAGSRNNSLQGPAPPLQYANAYNLNKIEEDLQDFDYTYLDHTTPQVGSSPQTRAPQTPQTPQHPQFPEPRRPKVAELSPVRTEGRTNSISSTQSPHRLKSILKSSNTATATAAAAVATVTAASKIDSDIADSDTRKVPRAVNSHTETHEVPQEGTSEGTSEETREDIRKVTQKPPQKALQKAPQKAPRELPRQDAHKVLQPSPDFEPSHRLASLTSNGTSIKFLDKVETIPYYSDNHKEIIRDEEYKKNQALQDNVDLYSKALKVASERVFGSPVPPVAHASPNTDEVDDFAAKKSEKKTKKDEKLDKMEASGVSKNYVYTNHHKDFTMRSMRNSDLDEPRLTRKERAKEEKRQLKEEEKQHAERLKVAEKQRKQEEKEEKEAKKRDKNRFSLFKRNKRRGSVGGSSLGSSEVNKTFSNENAIPGSNIELIPSIPEDPLHVSNAGSSTATLTSKRDGIIEDPVAAQIVPAALPASTESHNKQDNNAELSQGITLLSKTETEYFLTKSPTFDDDDDEFVDVPDNLVDDAYKKVSVVPILDADAFSKSPANSPKKPGKFSVVSSDSVADIPASKEVSETPNVLMDDHPESLDPGHIVSEFLVNDSPKHYQPEDLPTLVSGKDGAPEVLTNSDKFVFQSRFPDSPKDDSVANSKGGSLENVSPVELLCKENQSSGPASNHGVSETSKSFVVSDKNVTTTRKDKVMGMNVDAGHNISALHTDADQEPVTINEPQEKVIVNNIETERNPQNSDAKSKSKKASKLKKVIEKYFVNNYSR